MKGNIYEKLELELFDLSGKLVKRKTTRLNNQIELSRENLQSGIYTYQLKGNGELLSTGKVIVE